jgi:Ni/Co efflux regulator RcnB
MARALNKKAPKKSAAKKAAPAQTKPHLTSLYKAVEPLNVEKHGHLNFNNRGRYSFARGLYSSPINTVEFVAVARRLPILFVPGGPPLPIALLSLTPGENKMVDDRGRWMRGHYVPAYLRRYPFILQQNKQGNDVELSIDRSTDTLSEEGQEPLFENKKPSRITEKYAKFAAIYSREQNRTYHFADYCQKKKLFRDGPIDIKATVKRGIHLDGFLVIDAKKLRDLPDKDVLYIWRQGWAPIIFAHLDSLGHFGVLLD